MLIVETFHSYLNCCILFAMELSKYSDYYKHLWLLLTTAQNLKFIKKKNIVTNHKL